MKSIAFSALASILMLLLQATWLSHGILLGIIPNLALGVILFTSFINKDGQGIISAFLAGLVADLLSAAPLGYFAFLYAACAYIATLLSYVTEKDFFIIPFLMGAGATIVMGVLSRIVMGAFSANIHAYQLFSAEFGIELIINGLSTVILFALLSFVRKFFEHSPKKALP